MRQPTWNSIGVSSSKSDFDTLIKESGLDYEVGISPLYAKVNSKSVRVKDRCATVRLDTEETIGVVSSKYKVVQNRDALEFVKSIDNIEFLKAGSVNSGSVFLITGLPEIKILNDSIRPHLIFRTSHDGSSSVRATICMLRIVCENQIVAAMKNSPATVSVSHTGNIQDKLDAAQSVLRQINQYVKDYDYECNLLASTKITSGVFNEVIDKFFSDKPEDYSSNRRYEKALMDRISFVEAYNQDDNSNFIGTKMGLVNAYSDYLTHYEPSRKSSDWEIKRFSWNLNPVYMNEFLKYVRAA